MTLLNVPNVFHVLNVLNVLNVLSLLDMPKDASLACWALFCFSLKIGKYFIDDNKR